MRGDHRQYRNDDADRVRSQPSKDGTTGRSRGPNETTNEPVPTPTNWGLIVSLILVVVLAVFGLVNTQPATVNLVFARLETSLIVVIVSSAVLGAVVALLVSWRYRRTHRRR